MPSVRVYDAALSYELDLLAKAVNTRHKEARLVRRGLRITIASGATGYALDRPATRQLIVRSLASFSRTPVALPVQVDQPSVTVASAQPRTADGVTDRLGARDACRGADAHPACALAPREDARPHELCI